ncbi:unnamed protein product [Rotaria sordida]|uniref:Uncharacterized protein n=1 Tax=Rotaria sordida TaxID=392033 RepID=A0A813UUM8_9BILA|nr:unnamed protein product [Rotaria sordida]CAF0832581.1 unnamed protein product [Rotaria sordida]
MSETTTNTTSDNTLIHDSQLTGFSVFRESLGYCFCRLFKRSSAYNISSISKHNEEELVQQSNEPPSYINQALEGEKQARKGKLEKIAKTLPDATPNITSGIKGGLSSTQTSRSTTRVTQATPLSGITSAQTRSQINTPISKSGISTITKPSPSTVTTKNNRKESDETTDSSDEESSSDDDKSSDSDNARAKRPPINHANKR